MLGTCSAACKESWASKRLVRHPVLGMLTPDRGVRLAHSRDTRQRGVKATSGLTKELQDL